MRDDRNIGGGRQLAVLQGGVSMCAASSPDGLADSSPPLFSTHGPANRPGRTPPGTVPDPGLLPVGTPAEAFEPAAQDPGWQPDNFDQLPFPAPGGGFNTSPFPQKSRRHVIKAAEGS